jgi:integrase
VRFHDLRHTCATLLLTKVGHAQIVPEMLVHSSIAITLDTYGHILPGLEDGAASAMNDVFDTAAESTQQVPSD